MLTIKHLLAASVMMVLFACKKDGVSTPPPNQPPPPVDTSSYVRLMVNGVLPTNQSAFALLTINDANGMPIETNKKIRLHFKNGEFGTDSIKLPKGGFRVSKFIVLNENDSARYATPLANTSLAGAVNTPLPLSFSLTEKGTKRVNINAIPIRIIDSPGDFGYSNSDFGLINYTNIKVHLKITVGNIVYDSLPGTLKIKSTDDANNQWTRTVELTPGMNTIRLPESHKTYQLELNKWNITSTRTVNIENAPGNMVVQMDGFRQPKRLNEKTVYREVMGSYTIDDKNEYTYNANGSLHKIKYYQKLPQFSAIQHIHTFTFVYAAGLLTKIERHDKNSVLQGFTNFEYAGNRIVNMIHKSYDQETYAYVQYSADALHSLIDVDYLYSNGNALSYNMKFRHGNKVSDHVQSSTGAGGAGAYQYDHNINPFAHVNYPDLYFTNSSKNNVINEQGGYVGSIPSVVIYKYEYTYDNDGYPTELVRGFRGATSGAHLYNLKTIYTY